MGFVNKFLRVTTLQLLFFILFASSASAATFTDDFNDGNADGWIPAKPWSSAPSSGNWRVEDGRVAQDQGGDHLKFLMDGLNLGTQTVETLVLNHDNGQAGLSIWHKNEDNWVNIFYPYPDPVSGQWGFIVHEKWCIEACARDVNETRTGYPHVFNGRTWHTLKLEANSETGKINVYLDEEYAFTHTVGVNINRAGLSGYVSSNAGGSFDNFKVTSEESPQAIGIDLEGKNNKINLKNKNVTVAILSSSDFNAPVQVDKTTLTFGKTGDENSLLKCDHKGKDVNKDGLKDLTCTFSVKKAGFVCGDTEAVLRGKMISTGNDFVGKQSILLKPCK